MKALLLILAIFFVCKVENRAMRCLPCSDMDCLATYTTEERLSNFKDSEVTPRQVLDLLKDQGMILGGRMDVLESKIERKRK